MTVPFGNEKRRDSGVFSVEKTFDCGQAFRFSPVGGDPRVVCGSVRIGEGEDARITVDGTREEEGFLTLAGCTAEEFGSRWRTYLDLDEDYGAGEKRILDALPEGASRDAMADALRAGRGIRLLRQDPWEMLVTSILTQNNNIPRIRGIAARLCAASGGRFPEPADILRIGTEGLYALGCGFRAKYLTDAAERTADGRADPRKIEAMGTEEARKALAEGMYCAASTIRELSMSYTSWYPCFRVRQKSRSGHAWVPWTYPSFHS